MNDPVVTPRPPAPAGQVAAISPPPAPARRTPAAVRALLGLSVVGLVVVIGALPGAREYTETGYDAAAQALALSDWWTLWRIPPVETGLVVLLALVLAQAVRRAEPAQHRRAAGMAIAAIVTLVIAITSPIAGLAQGGMFSAHMSQHVLIGALAPLLALLALPRAVPVAGVAPNRILRFVLHPVVAFLIWTAGTVVWLLPEVHHFVYMNQFAWVLQQVSFFVVGIALWAPMTDRIVPAPIGFSTGGKTAYMIGVWSVGLTLANVYWFAGSAFYDTHTAAADAWGISPQQDQAHAGTVMMTTHCFLAFGAIAVVFFTQARKDGLAQRLIEAGADPDEVRWQSRYGDLDAMAIARGVSLRDRPGID